MALSEECIIWESPAQYIGGYASRDGSAFYSPRAGGRYFISRSAAIDSRLRDVELKVRITHEIVSANLRGEVIEITTDTISKLSDFRIPSANERADRLLGYFIGQSRYLGMKLSFPMSVKTHSDSSLNIIGMEWGESTAPLFAYSDSTEKDEVNFLINILIEEQCIKVDRPGSLEGLTVLPAGYARADRDTRRVRSNQAFVAMWFNSSMDEAYNEGIEPAILQCGYSSVRIDRIEHINKIDDQIVAEIRRSKFLVADFTSEIDKPRGGVYFEAGFAFGLGIPVIWTCRADLIGHVHFDTRQFNHITWSSPIELQERLATRIRATIT